MATANLQLPPGFRFHPTDEELVMHYLVRRCTSQSIAVPIVAEIDLYKYNPWELPGKALYGEKEWYFFTPRDRKYPNGSRPNRAAGSGYWKATGADKRIGHPRPVGIKKALVFYSGKAPKGDKTNWIMHEYRLADVDHSARKKNSLRLDDWVLCRIYNKKGTIKKYSPPLASAVEADEYDEYEDTKPENLRGFTTASLLARTTAPAVGAAAGTSDVMHFSPADSMPRLQTDSSCSEQVVSAEVTAEVQSEPKWKCEWDSIFDFGSGGGSYLDAMDFRSSPVSGCVNHMSPLQEMFLHLQKPF